MKRLGLITRIFFMFGLTIVVISMVKGCKENDSPPSSAGPISPPTKTPPSIDFPVRITFSGIGTYGIFDPSLQKDPNSERVWMTYSAVEDSWPSEFAVNVHLAYSDNSGATWNELGIISNDTQVTTGLIDLVYTADVANGSRGIWMSETSSLVYDSNASSSEKWKVVWHEYLKVDGAPGISNDSTSYFVELGQISYKTAATPQGLINATKQKFITGFGYNAIGDTAGTPSFPTIAGAALMSPPTDLNASDPLGHLDNCVFGEPDLFVNTSGTYLSLACQDVSATPIGSYGILLKCADACTFTDPTSWSYIGRITSPSDSGNINTSWDKGFSGADIFEHENEIYFVTTPLIGASKTYSGCVVLKFSNIDSATLIEEAGHFKVYLQKDGTSGSHNGACTFSETTSSYGLFHSQHDASVTDGFQIYMTGTTF